MPFRQHTGTIDSIFIGGFFHYLHVFLSYFRLTIFSPSPSLLERHQLFLLSVPESIIYKLAEIGVKERNGEYTVPEIWRHPEVNGFVPADRN